MDEKEGNVRGLASRYLLRDLPQDATEEEVLHYFSVFGEVEEVDMRKFASHGDCSVKFANPTIELRSCMLDQEHLLRGQPFRILTWKMEKLGRADGGRGAGKAGKPSTAGKPTASGIGMPPQFGGKAVARPSAVGAPYGLARPTSAGVVRPGSTPYGKGGLPRAGAGNGKGAMDNWAGWNDWAAMAGWAADFFAEMFAYGKAKAATKGAARIGPTSVSGKGKGAGAAAFPMGQRSLGLTRGTGEVRGKGGGKEDGEKGLASRYVLCELPEDVEEEELREYFGQFGEVAEVDVRRHPDTGKTLKSSVKFAAPTLELRKVMLDQPHEIRGQPIAVKTWKMLKIENWQDMKAKGITPKALQGKGVSSSNGAV